MTFAIRESRKRHAGHKESISTTRQPSAELLRRIKEAARLAAYEGISKTRLRILLVAAREDVSA